MESSDCRKSCVAFQVYGVNPFDCKGCLKRTFKSVLLGDRMKIAFVGTHCSGKSSRVREFTKVLRALGLSIESTSDIERDCPYPISQEGNFDSQKWILENLMKLETLTLKKKPDILVCDRSSYDTIPYSAWLYDHSRMFLNDYLKLKDDAMEWGKTYDTLIYCPSLPLREDNIRDGADVIYQRDIARRFEILLKSLGSNRVLYLSDEGNEVRSGLERYGEVG